MELEGFILGIEMLILERLGGLGFRVRLFVISLLTWNYIDLKRFRLYAKP